MRESSESSNRPQASAPGKLVISGEYVVLGGAEALVAAVDRRAVARWVPRSPGAGDGSAGPSGGSPERGRLPPEALVARRMAEEVFGVVPCELELDVSALRRGGRKLGLGSSAAGSAAAAGAVFAWHGEDLEDDAVRRRVLDLALSAHREVAPEGSGADVAAAVLGGFVAYRRRDGGFDATPVEWPGGLAVRVVWTGAEARTSDLVRAVNDFAARDPKGAGARRDALRDAAAAFLAAVRAGQAEEAVEAAEAHGEAMGELGRAAGAPIVEERLARVAELAREAGGAAKPSGAGGGDVAVAFFAAPEAAERFDGACGAAGLHLVSLALGAPGLSLVRT